ncbi:hypothetical protein IWQ61_005095, partial [Dispira simplex]
MVDNQNFMNSLDVGVVEPFILEKKLEITSSNGGDQLPQDEADLMATSRDIPDDGVTSSQGLSLPCVPNMEPMDDIYLHENWFHFDVEVHF